MMTVARMMLVKVSVDTFSFKLVACGAVFGIYVKFIFCDGGLFKVSFHISSSFE